MSDSRAEGHFSSTRLHVVSGKGGTGKTTVAAALAIALARDPDASREPRRTVFDPTLVVRQSTAPPSVRVTIPRAVTV